MTDINIVYSKFNSETVDNWVQSGWAWGVPISHEKFLDAKNGKWDMLLTPTKAVPKEWYPNLKNKKVLGLASGGGQQMPIFAALEAQCTLMDYSQKQIDNDLLVAERESYNINAVKADMTKRFPFEDDSFDLIFHPVSNCYIEDVMHVWKECFRVLKKGGVLMSGLDNGINFLFDENEKEIKYKLPFNPLKNHNLLEELLKKDDGIQFSHTIEEQIRGQLKAGFKLIDIYEDTNGEGILHEYNVPTFWAALSIK